MERRVAGGGTAVRDYRICGQNRDGEKVAMMSKYVDNGM